MVWFLYHGVFEFDPAKSAANLAKHGIDFEAAQALWSGDTLIAPSTHAVTEARELVIGPIGERIWTAIVTRRGDRIRIISVRRARPNEERLYVEWQHQNRERRGTRPDV